MIYTITVKDHRVYFDGSDYGSVTDCKANWPTYAAEIETKHQAWLAEQAAAQIEA